MRTGRRLRQGRTAAGGDALRLALPLALAAAATLAVAPARAESAFGDVGATISNVVGGRGGVGRFGRFAAPEPAASTASIAPQSTSGACQGLGGLTVYGGAATPRLASPVTASGEPMLSGLSLQSEPVTGEPAGTRAYCVTGALAADPSGATVPVPVQLEYQ